MNSWGNQGSTIAQRFKKTLSKDILLQSSQNSNTITIRFPVQRIAAEVTNEIHRKIPLPVIGRGINFQDLYSKVMPQMETVSPSRIPIFSMRSKTPFSRSILSKNMRLS